jgi:hypothetical protein
MTTNLTANKIKDTYSQLLHVDGGPAATEKVVYSGTGVATALKVGTVSASVGNVRIAGNTISSIDTDGDITLSPNGTGSVVIPKIAITDPAQARTALGLGTAALDDTGDFATAAQGSLADTALQPGGLGTMAAQDASAVNITGGSMSGVTLAVAFGDITGRANCTAYGTASQAFVVDTPTLVEFATTGFANGITIENNGSGDPTRLTFAVAGTYEVTSRLQFDNVDGADHTATVWFRLDGVDIPNSASELSITKLSEGGKVCHNITGLIVAAAGQYVEAVVAVSDSDVSLHAHPAQTTPYAHPTVPAAIIVANRIA